MNKGYSIQDNLDIYDRFLEEEIYRNVEIPEKVVNHLREIGYDGEAEPTRAMSWLALEIALDATDLKEDLRELETDLADNREYDRLQKIYPARNSLNRTKDTGVLDPLTFEVPDELPGKHFSPGRLYAEKNKLDEQLAMRSISENFNFSK